MGLKHAFTVASAAIAASMVPAVAQAAPPLAAYGALPGFELAAISPSGNLYAVVGTVVTM